MYTASQWIWLAVCVLVALSLVVLIRKESDHASDGPAAVKEPVRHGVEGGADRPTSGPGRRPPAGVGTLWWAALALVVLSLGIQPLL